MNEQELLLKQILNEIQTVKTNMATKQDVEYINVQLNKLNEKIDAQHIENINGKIGALPRRSDVLIHRGSGTKIPAVIKQNKLSAIESNRLL